jgi:hypothetical protein
MISGATLLAGVAGSQAWAQDTTRRARDSAAAADSIALVRELEAAQGAQPPPARSGPSNPRLLPDISIVGDLLGDLSRRGSTLEGGQRFAVREVELALQAAVDPYFRGEVFLGFNDEEGVGVEQAFVAATALPWALEARLGRFLMPVGKQNTTHRHDLHTIEYPAVLRRFLGEEGLKGTGVYLSKVFAPFGFYQELLVTAVDRFGESDETLVTAEPINTNLGGLGYSARLRNYVDLTKHANLEISASAITGKRPQPASGSGEITAVAARQTVVGVDLTYRWRPLQQGLYRSLIVQAELMRQLNERVSIPGYQGPTRGFTGWYLFGRYQLSRRTHLGARYDWVQDPEAAGARFTAGSGYLQFFPSEFSKLMVGYERVSPGGEPAFGRILLQATFALGPHKPHPF